MRVTLAALALMAAFAVPAQGADKEEWGYIKAGDFIQLSYGVPESDILTIAFKCEPKRIEIVSAVLPAKPKNAPATTTLRNGKAAAPHPGKVYFSKADEGFVFVASVARAPNVLDILRSGTALTIGIPGKQARVPLRGVTKPLAQFEAECFRKR